MCSGSAYCVQIHIEHVRARRTHKYYFVLSQCAPQRTTYQRCEWKCIYMHTDTLHCCFAHERLDYRNKYFLFDHQFKRSLKNDKYYKEKEVLGRGNSGNKMRKRENVSLFAFLFQISLCSHRCVCACVLFYGFISVNVILSTQMRQKKEIRFREKPIDVNNFGEYKNCENRHVIAVQYVNVLEIDYDLVVPPRH